MNKKVKSMKLNENSPPRVIVNGGEVSTAESSAAAIIQSTNKFLPNRMIKIHRKNASSSQIQEILEKKNKPESSLAN